MAETNHFELDVQRLSMSGYLHRTRLFTLQGVLSGFLLIVNISDEMISWMRCGSSRAIFHEVNLAFIPNYQLRSFLY